MRISFPSKLFSISLFVACSAAYLQASVDGNLTTATGATGPSKVNTLTPVSASKNDSPTPTQSAQSTLSNAIPPSQAAQTPQVAPGVAKEEVASAEPITNRAVTAQPKPQPESPKKSTPAAAPTKVDPFTGKITKNKVRMRTQPTFDGPILRELNANDLVVVAGESDDFYAIEPPADVKAYVYRTFVLDNVIEGNKVNARLKPDLDAPVVAQLNSGDRVEGTVDPSNNKWMQIKLPASTRFYIAKEYVEKAGDAGYKARLEKKRSEAQQLLGTAEGLAKAELQKPYDQIDIDAVKASYEHLIKNYPEFPEVGTKAKAALVAVLETYTGKKVTHLETQAKSSSSTIEANKKLSSELQAQKSKISQLEQQIEKNRQISTTQPAAAAKKPDQLPINMTAWLPAEEAIMAGWTEQTGKHSPKDFYEAQKHGSFILRGIIDPYARNVNNKPGDYLLLNGASKLPIAFLYSTRINLQDYVGREVAIRVVPRDNHHFAFPAYFVLELE